MDLHVLLQEALPSQSGQFLTFVAGQAIPLAGVDLGRLHHSCTALSVRSKRSATRPADRSPRWHSSTIAALNSGVNERREHGFFPALSLMDIMADPEGIRPDVGAADQP
ncbi:hypothetical protein ACWEQL_01970 [Kitasatospora sp. NPDC004240]